MMDRIIVEQVRCFHTHHSVPLRPLTLLVGDNSSGKTTFLALFRIAWDLCRGAQLLDFNEEPFLLGSYDQVASLRRGRAGRAKSFAIGAEVSPPGGGRRTRSPEVPMNGVTVMGQFTREAHPRLTEWTLNAGPFSAKIEYDQAEEAPLVTVEGPSGSGYLRAERWLPPGVEIGQFFSYLAFMGSRSRKIRAEGDLRIEGDVSGSDLELLGEVAYELSRSLGPRPYAFAPIRTRPQRTYEPLKDVARPEGSHVPVVLAKTRVSDPAGWERLRHSLESFGNSSGLFRDVRVRPLGKKASDPFQIRVKVAGYAFNLVDVGYGVSQVLPIVVDSLREREGSTFLLQQPEVHLHPKAQSELASFLALLAKEQNKRFVIETHSDYIVDRIRADVRDVDYLSSGDVSILYFERQNGGVTIQDLELDRFGNILNPPRGYRQFFLEEERRLLGG